MNDMSELVSERETDTDPNDDGDGGDGEVKREVNGGSQRDPRNAGEHQEGGEEAEFSWDQLIIDAREAAAIGVDFG